MACRIRWSPRVSPSCPTRSTTTRSFSDPTVTENLETARQTFDGPERAELFLAAQEVYEAANASIPGGQHEHGDVPLQGSDRSDHVVRLLGNAADGLRRQRRRLTLVADEPLPSPGAPRRPHYRRSGGDNAGGVVRHLRCAVARAGRPGVPDLGTQSVRPPTNAHMREQLGLDDPLLVRYWNWLTGALHGDLGTSLTYKGEDVSALIEPQDRHDRAARPSMASILILLVGHFLGTFGGTSDRWRPAVNALVGLGIAIPGFIAGSALISLFAVAARLVPDVRGGIRVRGPDLAPDPPGDRSRDGLERVRRPDDQRRASPRRTTVSTS